jgi:hypothetical protein
LKLRLFVDALGAFSSDPILNNPGDFGGFSADPPFGGDFLGDGFDGGGAANSNFLGVGEAKTGDAGDAPPNALLSLRIDPGVSIDVFVVVGVSTRSELARFLNDVDFFDPPVDPPPLPMLNPPRGCCCCGGGVEPNAELASDPFGESTAMGSGEDASSAALVAGSLTVVRSTAFSSSFVVVAALPGDDDGVSVSRFALVAASLTFCMLALRGRALFTPPPFPGMALNSNVGLDLPLTDLDDDDGFSPMTVAPFFTLSSSSSSNFAANALHEPNRPPPAARRPPRPPPLRVPGDDVDRPSVNAPNPSPKSSTTLFVVVVVVVVRSVSPLFPRRLVVIFSSSFSRRSRVLVASPPFPRRRRSARKTKYVASSFILSSSSSVVVVVVVAVNDTSSSSSSWTESSRWTRRFPSAVSTLCFSMVIIFTPAFSFCVDDDDDETTSSSSSMDADDDDVGRRRRNSIRRRPSVRPSVRPSFSDAIHPSMAWHGAPKVSEVFSEEGRAPTGLVS